MLSALTAAGYTLTRTASTARCHACSSPASPEDEIDFLVYGEGRGGKQPGEVAKIEKRLPSVVSLSVAEFAQMVLPAPV